MNRLHPIVIPDCSERKGRRNTRCGTINAEPLAFVILDPSDPTLPPLSLLDNAMAYSGQQGDGLIGFSGEATPSPTA
jgi:hypothetical protein